MGYALGCLDCGFEREVDDESRAYALARDHERDHGDHSVLITTVE